MVTGFSEDASKSTSPDVAVVRRYKLSGGMLAAIRSGGSGGVLSCSSVTERALVGRGIMHPVESSLTVLGREILGALDAARGAAGPAVSAAEDTAGSAPCVVDTAELAVGDVVLVHGMRVRLGERVTFDEPVVYGEACGRTETVYVLRGTVLNMDEVRADGRVPSSYLRDGDRDDVWVVQGNRLATWFVER